eukprot:3140219-Heterocapsa_arctica.AAC.1
MVRVLIDFRRRSTSPETREEERPCERPTKRPSSGRHVPGKVVGLDLQANTLFQDELTAGQAPQKVVRLELQEGTTFGALNT